LASLAGLGIDTVSAGAGVGSVVIGGGLGTSDLGLLGGLNGLGFDNNLDVTVMLNTSDLASMSFTDAGNDGGTVYLGLDDIDSLSQLGVDRLAPDLTAPDLTGGSDGVADFAQGIDHKLVAQGDLNWLINSAYDNTDEDLTNFFANLSKMGIDVVQLAIDPSSDVTAFESQLGRVETASTEIISFANSPEDPNKIEVKLLGQKLNDPL